MTGDQPPRGAASLSRREFVGAAAAAALFPGYSIAQSRASTAEEVATRIRDNLRMPWRDVTVDGFKAGRPSTPVTGIAVTVSASLDVLRRVVESRHNFVVTHEPTFYQGSDAAGAREADPVYLAKKEFIEENGVVVWRLFDHWRAFAGNPMTEGLVSRLGLRTSRVPGTPGVYEVPPTTLGELISHARRQLGARGGLRVVGPLDMPIRRLLALPGAADLPSAMAGMRSADVLLTGEPREWEVVPYLLDSGSGQPGKGMIAIGRSLSEEPGMIACAAWIKSLFPSLPVRHMAHADPYWSPA